LLGQPSLQRPRRCVPGSGSAFARTTSSQSAQAKCHLRMHLLLTLAVTGLREGSACFQPHTVQITNDTGPDGRSKGSSGMKGTNTWAFTGLLITTGCRYSAPR
jgi:hypothetical protein